MTLTEADVELIRAVTKDAMRELLTEAGMLQDLLTVKQAAAEAKCSRSTIHRYLRMGQLQRVGKRISRRELVAALRDGLPIRPAKEARHLGHSERTVADLTGRKRQ